MTYGCENGNCSSARARNQTLNANGNGCRASDESTASPDASFGNRVTPLTLAAGREKDADPSFKN